MLAAAAQRTSRLRLGTLITILSLYHPMRIIEEAVTLDQLSNGRLDLGVGRGVSPAELAFPGVSGEQEAQGRFDEAFAILRQGLMSDSVTFDGKYYKLVDAPVTSRPVQRPHPPLWYGTRTPAKAHGPGNVLRRHDQTGGAAVSGTPGHRGDAALRLRPRPPAAATTGRYSSSATSPRKRGAC
jgi:Luciferase-like monooxygenase